MTGRPQKRDWAAWLAHRRDLTTAEAARFLSCSPDTVRRIRRADPSLAGPRGKPGPRPKAKEPKATKPGVGRPRAGEETGRAHRLNIGASAEELAELKELAERLGTTATEAVWATIGDRLAIVRGWDAEDAAKES